MTGMLFALVCWVVWDLSPAHIELLTYDRQAILEGEWWRLWTSHFTHYSRLQLIADSAALFFLGLILQFYTRFLHLLFGFIFAMPVMMWLLLVFMPEVQNYRGATGLAAMGWMISSWFLIVESRSLSLKFWTGYLLLSILLVKMCVEAVAVWTPFLMASEGLELMWTVQAVGALLGIALFNLYDRIYLGRRKSKRRPSRTPDGKPMPLPLNAPRLQRAGSRAVPRATRNR